MPSLVGISSESTSIPNNHRSYKAETPLNPMKPACGRQAFRPSQRIFILAKMQSRKESQGSYNFLLSGNFNLLLRRSNMLIENHL
jgi:hypothetical protein